MLERDYQRRLVAELTRATGLILNKVGTLQEGKGWPDLYVPSPIWHGWIELKIEDRPLSGPQKTKLRLLNKCRVPCVVMRWMHGGEMICDWEDQPIEWRRRADVPKGEEGRVLLEQLRDCFS